MGQWGQTSPLVSLHRSRWRVQGGTRPVFLPQPPALPTVPCCSSHSCLVWAVKAEPELVRVYVRSGGNGWPGSKSIFRTGKPRCCSSSRSCWPCGSHTWLDQGRQHLLHSSKGLEVESPCSWRACWNQPWQLGGAWGSQTVRPGSHTHQPEADQARESTCWGVLATWLWAGPAGGEQESSQGWAPSPTPV